MKKAKTNILYAALLATMIFYFYLGVDLLVKMKV